MDPRRIPRLPAAPIALALAFTSVFVGAPAAHATEVVLLANKDTTLYSESGLLSNGSGEQFFAGVNAMNDVRRSLVAFDVAAALPPGATVVSAQLELTQTMTISPTIPVELHRALASWGEGASNAGGNEGAGAPALTGDATWTQRIVPGTLWASQGGDFAASASATTPIAGNGPYSWNSAQLAADVQGWLDAPATNFGWLLRATDESSGPAAKRFESRTSFTPSSRPRLRIVYAPPCANVPTSLCVGAVNSTGLGARIGSTGSASILVDDLTLTCDRLPPGTSAQFFFGRTKTQTPFGNGFLCVVGPHVRLTPALVVSPNGTVSVPLDLAGLAAAGLVQAGTVRHFQCQYRDVGGAGFNLSDALRVAFCE